MKEEIVIDAFKAGKYPQGEFTQKELAEIQSTYNPENYEAPILIGHLSDPAYQGKSTVPAFGWIGAVKHVGSHLKLVASQFSEQLKKLIKGGFYKKVSAAFFPPDDPNNPTPGKWHLHHLAFLGGAAPAVKGLEQIAFTDLKGLGVEFQEMEAEVEVDGEVIEEVEGMGVQDTLKDLSECFGNCLVKVEAALSEDIDMETAKQRCQLALSDAQSEAYHIMEGHWNFSDKLENLEEHKEAEMSEKKNWLVEMAQKVTSLITKRKESEVDAKKEQEYQATIESQRTEIVTLTAKVNEFTEAKKKEEDDKKALEAKAAEEKIVADIKTFCETKIKEGKMTPAMREKDEPIMVKLAKTDPESLKSFQEKYSVQVVPMNDLPPADLAKAPVTKLTLAAEYVAAHPAEFKDVPKEIQIQRAVYLESRGDIRFEAVKK